MSERSASTYILYLIAVITIALLTPFIFLFSREIIKSDILMGGKNNSVENSPVEINRVYSSESFILNLSGLDKKYTVIAQKALNDANTLILCSETMDYVTPYDILRFAVADSDGTVEVSDIYIMGKFLENVRSGSYTFSAFNDNTFFISDSQNGYLIDQQTLKLIKRIGYPSDMDIYEAVISNDKNAVAIASESGLYLADVDMKSIKELVASVQDMNGSVTGPRYPVWSGTDDYIYYTLYKDGVSGYSGRTTLVPGGNETFISLAGLNATAINGERLFYYSSSSSDGNKSSSFRCGFFDVATATMTDLMRSSVYYFNSRVSANGSLLATLSYNGMLQKLNVIDPESKRLIYSENFGKVISFHFSPDERGILVLAENEGKQVIKIIQISWHTVEY
ncbi:MAG: hypothetical protein AB9835_04565 [Eubacteriales bacterium]